MASNDEQQAIEQNFMRSWDELESFYDRFATRDGWEFLFQMKVFLAQLRAENYDHHLRAGQSLHRSLLSRSRKHGLREGQPCIRFLPYPKDDKTVIDIGYFGLERLPDQIETPLNAQPLVLTAAIKELLDRLLTYPIA